MAPRTYEVTYLVLWPDNAGDVATVRQFSSMRHAKTGRRIDAFPRANLDKEVDRLAGLIPGGLSQECRKVFEYNLKDNSGEITSFTPPALSDVLLWAKQSGALVELDKKPTTSFRNIISMVRAAGAEDNVVLITYNDQQAIEVANLAPDLMMTASVNSREHQEELEAAGVSFDHVVAWMGIQNPNPRAFAALGRRGVEAAFGTLGRPGERLDDQYIADGDLGEFQDLVDGGLTLLATDEPYIVADFLTADDDVATTCGVG